MSRTLYLRELRRNAGAVLAIGAILVLYVASVVSMYNPETTKSLEAIMSTMPDMFAAFGMSHPATTMTGFMLNYLYGFLFTWVALLLIMMMVNRMVVQPIDRGSLSCVLSTPASRLRIALTLALALLTSLVVTLALIIVAQLALAEAQYPGELDLPALARASAGLFCLWLFMADLCFASACCFRDGRVALWAGGGACLLIS